MSDQRILSHVTTSPVRRRAFLGGAAALGVAGLGGAGLLAGTGRARPAAAAVAIPEADQDALDLLQRMLRFDTQNHGQGAKTREHAEMLQAVWERAGVPVEIIDRPQPDNVHLIARIPWCRWSGRTGTSTRSPPRCATERSTVAGRWT
ncbi:hypothetical protein [Arthrobacter sp.]|uniref:hypothetical protein n=1 Tax=Arthrobacter sp. TaxID=1667 RepID=UPI003A92E31D